MPAFGILEALGRALEPSGIRLRGVVHFKNGEGPALAGGGRALSVVLLGNVGGSIWPTFSEWRENYAGRDPLDAWSKAVIGPIAERYGATPFYPSDPPYMPFQQWAMRAEGLIASPLGILIHPQYGLWHGYRGALAFGEMIESEPLKAIFRHAAPASTNPVFPPVRLERSRCQALPCSLAAPISLPPAGRRVHEGRLHCARDACPVGVAYRYPADQLRFHMAALVD